VNGGGKTENSQSPTPSRKITASLKSPYDRMKRSLLAERVGKHVLKNPGGKRAKHPSVCQFRQGKGGEKE